MASGNLQTYFFSISTRKEVWFFPPHWKDYLCNIALFFQRSTDLKCWTLKSWPLNRSDKTNSEVNFDFNERDHLLEGIPLWLMEKEGASFSECLLFKLTRVVMIHSEAEIIVT